MAILAVLADVAQLARASACHAEGRGFESLHPLSRKPWKPGAFGVSGGCRSPSGSSPPPRATDRTVHIAPFGQSALCAARVGSRDGAARHPPHGEWAAA